MDPRLKEIVDNYDSWKISLDGSFRFHCTECGKCCINREDILLTPRDLCNASKAMNMLPPAFVNAYCECYIGQDSRIPIVRLKPIGSIKRCPLLKDRKCSIHQAKPAVCAMFPVGRAVTIDKDSYNQDGVLSSQIQYILNPITCGDQSETHTVRDWLNAFHIPLEDEFFLKWHGCIAELSSFIRKEEKKIPEHVMNDLWTAVYIHLYLDYDPSHEFLPQFERNAKDVLELVHKLNGLPENAS